MKSSDIEKVIKYVKDNIEGDLTLKDIAKHMNYSEFHLSRSFKKQMGYTLREYIESIKVEKGIANLIDTQSSVTQVTFGSGHKSTGTFSNTFKKHTGLSPKKYKTQSTIAHKFLKKWIEKKSMLKSYEDYEITDNKLFINIEYPKDYKPQITCTGLFKSQIPKELPIVGIATVSNMEFVMDNIPNGEYYLLVCEIMEDLSLTKSYVLNDNYRAKIDIPLKFDGDTHITQTVIMRRPIEEDPPITMNLPLLLMKTFIQDGKL